MTGDATIALDEGHRLAVRQLREIQEESGGAVELLRFHADRGILTAEISVACQDIPVEPGGVALRARETVSLLVGQSFPLHPPSVSVSHQRFRGVPHVQLMLGRRPRICLYLAPDAEYDANDGMVGVVERLLDWFHHAAAGTLDPPGGPRHPPVAYETGEAGCIVIHADTPVVGTGPWVGVALASAVSDDRLDVIRWLDVPRVTTLTGSTEEAHVLAEEVGRPIGVGRAPRYVPAVLVPDLTGFEMPLVVGQLLSFLEAAGVQRDLVLGLMGWAAFQNQGIADGGPGAMVGGTDNRLHLLFGTPMRGIVGAERQMHLACQRFEPHIPRAARAAILEYQGGTVDARGLGAHARTVLSDELENATARWCRVYEMRPQIVARRDDGAAIQWLREKRVLILGCGALGAPVAEMTVRAGAKTVHLVDRGRVHPGILVRQPYSDRDIDRNKADALAERLGGIREDVAVVPMATDVLSILPGGDVQTLNYDVIIDATASRSVWAALERSRRRIADRGVDLITMMVGHVATRGVVAVSSASASGGGMDVLRRLGIWAHSGSDAVAQRTREDFFPHPPRATLFQPERGCSEPTFTGSAADMSALAGQLLIEGVRWLSLGAGMAASVVETSATESGARLEWTNDIVVKNSASHEVRIAPSALAEMKAEIRRGRRVRRPKVETGGLLLGQVNDAVGVAWVDTATGPPPDSSLSEQHFHCGTSGAKEVIECHRDRSAGVTSFLGYWHSHPEGKARPSPVDEKAMNETIFRVSPGARRAVVIIVGGRGDTWGQWCRATEMRPPEIYCAVLDRSSVGPDATDVSVPVDDHAWSGGYSSAGSRVRGRTRLRLSLRWPFLRRERDASA